MISSSARPDWSITRVLALLGARAVSRRRRVIPMTRSSGADLVAHVGHELRLEAGASRAACRRPPPARRCSARPAPPGHRTGGVGQGCRVQRRKTRVPSSRSRESSGSLATSPRRAARTPAGTSPHARPHLVERAATTTGPSVPSSAASAAVREVAPLAVEHGHGHRGVGDDLRSCSSSRSDGALEAGCAR